MSRTIDYDSNCNMQKMLAQPNARKDRIRSISSFGTIRKVQSKKLKVEDMIAKTKPISIINSRNLKDLSYEWQTQITEKSQHNDTFQSYLVGLNKKHNNQTHSSKECKKVMYFEPVFKLSHFRMYTNIKNKYNLGKQFKLVINTVDHPFKQNIIGVGTTIGYSCYIFPNDQCSYSYDIKHNTWEKLSYFCDRNGHSVATYDEQVYVFGGSIKRQNHISIVKATVKSKQLPYISYRSHSCMAVIASTLYIIGGIDVNNKVCRSIYVICLNTYRTKKIRPKNSKGISFASAESIYYNKNWSQLPSIDWATQERYIKEEGIYIFGGLDQNGKPTLSLKCLSIESMGWRILETTGWGPSERYGHASAYLPKPNILLICGGTNGYEQFGDIYILNLSIILTRRLVLA